jgi:hypothetical protein
VELKSEIINHIIFSLNGSIPYFLKLGFCKIFLGSTENAVRHNVALPISPSRHVVREGTEKQGYELSNVSLRIKKLLRVHS